MLKQCRPNVELTGADDSNIRQGIWEEAAGGEVAVSFAKLTDTTILGHTTAPTTWPVALHGLNGPARHRVLHD